MLMKTQRPIIIFPQVTNWGVKATHSPATAKRIILTNILGSLLAVNLCLCTLIFSYLGHMDLALYTITGALIHTSWPVLNYFGLHYVSRLGMVISSNLLGLGLSVLLPDCGYHQGFFVMAGMPFLLFGLEEKKSILFSVLLPLVLYPLAVRSDYFFSGLHLVTADVNLNTFHSFMGTMIIMLIFLMFYFLSKENSHAEELLEKALRKVESEKKKIQELNDQIEIQRARAFSSAKFAALGEMAGGIAHEINNPMTVINLKAQQLKYVISSECPNESALQCVDAISKAVIRVARIIDAMRMFSRDGGNSAFEYEPLKMIVENCMKFCGERFKNHNVDLKFSFPDDNLKLRCRSVQITQVMLNLIYNAFDAVQNLPEKWVKVEVVKSSDNKKVYISVTDSGNAICESLHEQIFLPFYTTKPVGKGTGLGLSLARQIIHDHGGIIVVDTASKNTRFVVEFPL